MVHLTNLRGLGHPAYAGSSHHAGARASLDRDPVIGGASDLTGVEGGSSGPTGRGTQARRIGVSRAGQASGARVETTRYAHVHAVVGLPDVSVLAIDYLPGERSACTSNNTSKGPLRRVRGGAWVKARRVVELVDLQCFGRPARLVWHQPPLGAAPRGHARAGSWTGAGPRDRRAPVGDDRPGAGRGRPARSASPARSRILTTSGRRTCSAWTRCSSAVQPVAHPGVVTSIVDVQRGQLPM